MPCCFLVWYDLTLCKEENREAVLSRVSASTPLVMLGLHVVCRVATHTERESQDGASSPNPPDLVFVFLVRGDDAQQGSLSWEGGSIGLPHCVPHCEKNSEPESSPFIGLLLSVCCFLSAPLIKVASQPNLISSHLTWD